MSPPKRSGYSKARSVPSFRHSRSFEFLRMMGEQHPFPIFILLGVTNRCNLTCEHCLIGTEQCEKEMSLSEIERVFDDLAAAGALVLALTGGEVGLRVDLEEIVAAATSRGFLVRLKTNGTLLDDERVERLFTNGLRYLEASIYHTDSEKHDNFVGKSGCYDRTMNAARRFVSLGGYVSINFVAMSWNYRCRDELLSLCELNDFSYRIAPIVACRNDGDLLPLGLNCDQHELETFLSDKRILDASEASFPSVRAPSSSVCDGGGISAYIMPNGDLRTCQRLPMVLGNVLRTPIEKIWSSSVELQEFRALRWGDLPECARCELSGVCERCPASALLENGNLDSISRNDCLLAEVKARLLRRHTMGHGKPSQ